MKCNYCFRNSNPSTDRKHGLGSYVCNGFFFFLNRLLKRYS
uniref:Uncharacterized protein n=1 Tax=Anguilla anguilla TaxID=7936 RepID=A0A0E9TQB8_ANGAN